MSTRNLGFGCLLALFVGGCSGPSSYDDYRDQLASRYCDYEVRCGLLGASETSQCPAAPALGTTTTTNLDVDAALGRNSISFHGGRAQKCLDTLKTLPCDGKQANVDVIRYCNAIIEPKLAPGKACVDDVECLGGGCVPTTALGCGGTCVAFAATGAACVQTGSDPSQLCDPTVHFCDPTTSTCKLLLESGGKCSADSQCAFDLACVSGKCATPPHLAVGATCGPLLTLPPCAEGLACNANNVCAKELASGAACTSPQDCKDGLVCAAGTCTAWSDIGKPCVSNGAGSNCPADQACSNSVCVSLDMALAGPGSTCSPTIACQDGLWCNNGVCSYQKGLDGSCTSTAECGGVFTCDTTKQTCVEPAC